MTRSNTTGSDQQNTWKLMYSKATNFRKDESGSKE